MGKADELTEHLAPLARKGNTFAAVACLRMLTAEDPDAEAERILEQWADVVNRMVAAFKPVLERYVAAGIRFAEGVANSGFPDESGSDP